MTFLKTRGGEQSNDLSNIRHQAKSWKDKELLRINTKLEDGETEFSYYFRRF